MIDAADEIRIRIDAIRREKDRLDSEIEANRTRCKASGLQPRTGREWFNMGEENGKESASKFLGYTISILQDQLKRGST